MAFTYGGQAVIEGVMIRGRSAVTVAVREREGTIITHTEQIAAGAAANRWARVPFVRGIVALADMLRMGTRMLLFSAVVSMGASSEEEALQAMEKQQSRGALVVSLAIAVLVFFVGPLLLVNRVEKRVTHSLAVSLAESATRIGFFVGYILLISQFPDIQRVFAYHGAEHKAVHAFEHNDPLTPAEVQKYPTAHPRCGTAFLMQVMLVSSVLFSLFGRPRLLMRLVLRLISVPLIAGISYELLRVGARYGSSPLVQLMTSPGLALQALTTRQPDDAQVEVAIAAMQRAVEIDTQEETQRDA